MLKIKISIFILLLLPLLFPVAILPQPKEKEITSLSQYKDLISFSIPELYQQAYALYIAQKEEQALIYYTILINKYETGRDSSEKHLYVLSLSEAGNIYYQKSSYSKAMELYLEGLRICEEDNIEDVLTELYKNIGNVYSSHDDFETGNTYYEKALVLARKANNIELQNKLFYNLTGAYCLNGELEKAKFYYEQMVANNEDSPLYNYSILMNKALIYEHEEKEREAIHYYNAAAFCATDYNLPMRYAGAAYSRLADLYEEMNMLDSALYYLTENEKAAYAANQMDLLIATQKSLANVYQKKKNLSKSLAYKSQYLDLSDSIFNQKEFNDLKNAQFLYEIDKHNATINKLSEDKKKKEIQIVYQQRLLLIITVSTVLFIILLIILYRQKKDLSIAYNDLFDRNKEHLETEMSYKKRLADLDTKLKNERKRINELQGITDENVMISQLSPVGSVASKDMENTNVYPYPLQREKLVADIQNIMDNPLEFCNSDFNLEKLVALVGSNTRYVSQIINEEYNKNFRTLLNEHRIKEAMLRLIDMENYGHLTIKAISESVGYKSQANFISVFTKQTGIKPFMYQKLSQSRKRQSENSKSEKEEL